MNYRYDKYQNKSQIQVQDYSQLLRQKEDLVNCNNSFGMLLSSMESLFKKKGYNITLLFLHYNHFNDISWKTTQQIKEQLYTDLMAYKLSKMAYIQKYGTFDYPDYPPIENIKEIIKKWKKIVNEPEEKKLCEEILDLISEKDNKPLSYYQNRIENIKRYYHADPVEQFNLSNRIHDQINRRHKKIKSDLELNPYTKFGLHIGEPQGSSEFSHIQIKKSFENIDYNQKKMQSEIEKNINILFESIYKIRNGTNAISIFYYYIQIVKENLEQYFKKYKNIEFIYISPNIKENYRKIEDLSNKKYNDIEGQYSKKIINLFKSFEQR